MSCNFIFAIIGYAGCLRIENINKNIKFINIIRKIPKCEFKNTLIKHCKDGDFRIQELIDNKVVAWVNNCKPVDIYKRVKLENGKNYRVIMSFLKPGSYKDGI